MLALHSQDGFDGGILISGSSDHSIRSRLARSPHSVWDLMKQRIATKITVMRPSDEFLMKNNFERPKHFHPEKAGEVPKNVCAYCFHGEFIFTGYEDGLICAWSIKVRPPPHPEKRRTHKCPRRPRKPSQFHHCY